MVLGFISVKYVFTELGRDALGIIYFSILFNAMACSALELGVSATTVREVSGHFKKEPEYIRALVRMGSLFYWSSFIILGLIIYFLAPLLVDRWITLDTMEPLLAVKLLRILIISALVALPKTFFVSLVRGLQRMEYNNLIDVATIGLQQLGIIIIIIFGGSVFSVVLWLALTYALSLLSYMAIIARFFTAMALLPGYSLEVLRRNYNFATRTMTISILSVISTQIDKVILSKILPVVVMGYYGVLFSIVRRGMTLTGAVSQAAYPTFTEHFKAGDKETLNARYDKMQDLVCFGTVPILAAIPMASMPLFTFIFNEEVAAMLFLPTIIFSIGFYLNATLSIPYIFSLAVGKPGIAARMHIYDLFITLPATILLVYYYGLLGASLALLFFYIFRFIYFTKRFCSECIHRSVGSWYVHILKIIALLVCTFGTSWTLLAFIGDRSMPYLIVAYIMATITFFMGAYFMIGNELKVSVRNALNLKETVAKI